MHRTEAFNEYYRGLDIGQQIASVGYCDGSASVTLSICRGVDAPAFGERELSMLRALTPHWVNAYAVQRRLSWLQRRVDTLEAAIDSVPMAMFLLDADRGVVRMNAVAELMLSKGNVLRLARGKLQAPFDAHALDGLLHAACRARAVETDLRQNRRAGAASPDATSGRRGQCWQFVNWLIRGRRLVEQAISLPRSS